MKLIDLAYMLRPPIEKAAKSLDDTDALTGIQLYPLWKPDTDYETGDRIRHDGVLYRVLQSHASQNSWKPDVSPSLFTKVLIPDPDVIPEWEQPDSTNPYMTGDRVTHNGRTWTSDVDNNVWEPGQYGWTAD